MLLTALAGLLLFLAGFTSALVYVRSYEGHRYETRLEQYRVKHNRERDTLWCRALLAADIQQTAPSQVMATFNALVVEEGAPPVVIRGR